jgi:hypothetical protein
MQSTTTTNTTQQNTDPFYHDVSINLVNLSITEDRATALAKSITGSENVWKGYYVKSTDDYRIVSYTRWASCPKNLPTTLYADALIIEVTDASEYSQVKDYVTTRGRIPLIIFYSDHDFTSVAETFKHSNARWIKKSENDYEKLLSLIVESFHTVNSTIKTVFDKFDLNGNGLIEKAELEQASSDLGENISSEEFKECFKVMDENKDGAISLQEFTAWWKLGRQNSHSMKRLVQLQMLSSKLENGFLSNIKKELEEVKYVEENMSKHHFKIYSEKNKDENFSNGFGFYLNLMKGEERIETLNSYLLRFSDHTRTKHARFIDVVFNFNEKVGAEESINWAKGLVEFGITMLSSIDKSMVDAFNTFIHMEYLTGISENSVLLRFRQKLDTQKDVDSSLAGVLYLIEKFSGDQQILIDLRSGFSFDDVFSKNMTLAGVMEKYFVELKMNLMRNHVRAFFKGKSSTEQGLFNLLTAPHDLSVNCRMSFEDLIPHSVLKENGILNMPLGGVKGMLDGILMMVPDVEMLKKVDSVELNANVYDIFANLKLKVNGLFK